MEAKSRSPMLPIQVHRPRTRALVGEEHHRKEKKKQGRGFSFQVPYSQEAQSRMGVDMVNLAIIFSE